MNTLKKAINLIALLIVVLQAVNIFTPATPADAASPYGKEICFYPSTAKRTAHGKFSFLTVDPTEKMWLVITSPATGGIITYDEGGPSSATLNKLFPWLAKP